MGEYLPSAGADLLGVDADDDALAAEFLGALAHEFRPGDGGGVDRHLVGAGEKELADILDRAHAPTDGQRHEALLCRAADHVVERIAVLVAGGDRKSTRLNSSH